jgi:hypothetical protein
MTRVAEGLRRAGAAEAVRLQEPVARRESLEKRPDSGVRSPVGLPRGLAATTPMSDVMSSPVITPASVGGTKLLTPGPTTMAGAAAQITDQGPPHRKPAPRVPLVLALVAMAGGGALLWTQRTVGSASPHSNSAPQTISTAGMAPAPPSPLPENVTIDLAGVPAAAKVRLDGRATTLPVTVPRGSDSHAMVVEAEGYTPLTLSPWK